MEINIYRTAYISLLFQLFIGLLCIYGLQIKLNDEDQILHEILLLETIVQIIEFIFYLWLITNFHKINYDVTFTRYFDWVITTPTMLLSIVLFMIYVENKDKKIVKFKETIKENKKTLLIIFFSNFFMLLFGFLGEINKLSKSISFSLGSIMFTICYYTIYKNFLGSNKSIHYLFYITLTIWCLYGIAFLLPYALKNISYNILDIFSKNLNGLFIFGYILFISSSSFSSSFFKLFNL